MSTPAERSWYVNTYLVDEQTGAYVPDPHALTTALLELVGIMSRVGGTVQMASRRQEVAPGRVETVAVVFRWRSFAPMDKSQEAPPVEQDGDTAPPPAPVPDLPPVDEPLPAPPPIAVADPPPPAAAPNP